MACGLGSPGLGAHPLPPCLVRHWGASHGRAGALGRPLASFAAFAASAERCSHSGPRSHASLASRPWTLIVLPDRDLRVTSSTRSTPRSIHCSCVLFAPLFRAPGGVRVECALATFATTSQASPARNTNSSLVQANSHVLANLPQCCPRIRSAAAPTAFQLDGLLLDATPHTHMPKVSVCGNFGCMLENLHRGLCQPVISKRGKRNAISRLPSRAPTSYVQRVVPAKPKKPERKLVQLGENHQVEELPTCCGAVCEAEYSRGDVLIALDTKDAVQATFSSEKKDAAAWEAGRDQRMMAADMSHIFSHLPRDESPPPLLPLNESYAPMKPHVLPSTPPAVLALSDSPDGRAATPVTGAPVVLGTKVMAVTPGSPMKAPRAVVPATAVRRLDAPSVGSAIATI